MNPQLILNVIIKAETVGLVDCENINLLTGLSGKKVVGVLQRLARLYTKYSNTCYLEVGIFQGLTLLSVANTTRNMPCYGIDNFAFFDKETKNIDIINSRIKKLELNNVCLINKDYEDALERLREHIGGKKIGVYFIDGPHDYRSQLMCLELVLPYLHENAVIIVDDCNYRHVRQANRDFLVTNPQYKLIFEAYTHCHPHNMSIADKTSATDGWWNGVNIMLRDTNNELQSMYPPTERSRCLFENEHIVHSDKMAIFAPNAVKLIGAIYDKEPLYFIRQIGSLLLKFKKHKELKKLYCSMNTYSEGLPSKRFNRTLNNK